MDGNGSITEDEQAIVTRLHTENINFILFRLLIIDPKKFHFFPMDVTKQIHFQVSIQLSFTCKNKAAKSWKSSKHIAIFDKLPF